MPYALKKKGDEWCVYNKETGESKGCSSTRAMGIKHMRALYATESDWENKDGNINRHSVAVSNSVGVDDSSSAKAVMDPAPTIQVGEHTYAYVGYTAEEHQLEKPLVNYNPVGGDGERACANCQWFVAPDACILVRGEISPTGVSSLWRLEEPEPTHSIPVTIESVADDVVFKTSDDDTTLIEKTLDRIKSGARSLAKLIVGEKEGPLTLYKVKGADGVEQLRFMAWWSNHYEDRGTEILPLAAHKEYISWADNEDNYPDLIHWHAIGTEYGKVDFLDLVDGFNIASGYVLPGKESIAYKIAEQGDKVGMSHGSLYRTDPTSGEILQFRAFEISTLPIERAKNSWTAFKVGNWEQEMGFTAEKISSLKAAGFSDEQISAAEQKTAAMKDALGKMGIAYKDDAPPDTTSMMDTVTQLADSVGTKFEEVGGELTAIKESLAPLLTLAEQIQAANASLDDRVAATVAPKGAQQQVYAASKDDGNVATTQQTQQQNEWSRNKFSELVGLDRFVQTGS